MSIDEPVREAPHIADDSALRVRINTLLAEARSGDAAFERDFDAAARATARAGARRLGQLDGGAAGLSRVEAARGRASDAAAELHQLAVARAGQPTSEADQAALDAAIAQADGIVAAQQARLNRIRR